MQSSNYTQNHKRNSHMASLMVSTSKDQRRTSDRTSGKNTIVGRGGSSSAAKRASTKR